MRSHSFNQTIDHRTMDYRPMKKVLIAPLDWGLGHATRCIPIIRELLDRNCEVCIAGSGDALMLLKNEFPFLAFFSLPAYDPIYPSSGAMVWKMAAQLPKFASVIRREHRQVEHLIIENKIDVLISDNRYGCWSSRIPSVFITHQNKIIMPSAFNWLAGIVKRWNATLIERFSMCWIPDVPGKDNLTGDLSLVRTGIASSRVKCIGNLSRFTLAHVREIKYDVVCVFSGPEPQRSMLEEIVLRQVRASGLRYFVVGGIISRKAYVKAPTAEYTDFLNSKDLQSVIEQSSCVIARSGYSTIMDLVRLGKKAIFIPTPGQTEQEYLAARLMKMRIAYAMNQDDFDLKKAWDESKTYTGFHAVDQGELLTGALDEILKN
jgi:uncharacterized protein (TIGR00661 family)